MKNKSLRVISIFLVYVVILSSLLTCQMSVYASSYTCGDMPKNSGLQYDCHDSPLNAGGVVCSPIIVSTCNICGGSSPSCGHVAGSKYGGTVCSPTQVVKCNLCGGNYSSCPHTSGTTYGGTVCSPSNGICNICYTNYATCPHSAGTSYGGTVCSTYTVSICNICGGNYSSCPHSAGNNYGGTFCSPSSTSICNICQRTNGSCSHTPGVVYGNYYHVHNSSCPTVYTTHTHTNSCISYSVVYSAGSGGYISGATSQSVQYGGSASAVIAIASPGYLFNGWSDGNSSASRSDTNVTSDRSITANFTFIATNTPPPNTPPPVTPTPNPVLPAIYSEDNPVGTVSGTVDFAGWFLDGRGVNKIDIYIDGVLKGQASYGASREDVYRAYPAYNNHNAAYHFGFNTTLLTNGTHSYYILETANNGATVKGATVSFITSNSPTATPVPLPAAYSQDNPPSCSTVNGIVNFAGWFLDGKGVNKIEVYIDGILKGQASYGGIREDVYNVYSSYNNHNAGYNFNYDTTQLSNGTHTYYILETANTGATVQGNTVTFVVANATSQDDMGNDSTTATTKQTDTTIIGSIDYEEDVDYMRFDISIEGNYVFFSTGGTDIVGSLYDVSGNMLEENDDYYENNSNFHIKTNLSPGSYYLEVKGFSGSDMGGYKIGVLSPNYTFFDDIKSEYGDSVGSNTFNIYTIADKQIINLDEFYDKVYSQTDDNGNRLVDIEIDNAILALGTSGGGGTTASVVSRGSSAVKANTEQGKDSYITVTNSVYGQTYGMSPSSSANTVLDIVPQGIEPVQSVGDSVYSQSSAAVSVTDSVYNQQKTQPEAVNQSIQTVVGSVYGTSSMTITLSSNISSAETQNVTTNSTSAGIVINIAVYKQSDTKTNKNITNIQKALINAGCWINPDGSKSTQKPTGYYGVITRASVIKFQRDIMKRTIGFNGVDTDTANNLTIWANFGRGKSSSAPILVIGNTVLTDVKMINGKPYARLRQVVKYLDDGFGLFETDFHTDVPDGHTSFYIVGLRTYNKITKTYCVTDANLYDGFSGSPYCDIEKIAQDLGFSNKIYNISTNQGTYLYIDAPHQMVDGANALIAWVNENQSTIDGINLTLLLLQPEIGVCTEFLTLYTKSMSPYSAALAVASKTGRSVTDIIKDIKASLPLAKRLAETISRAAIVSDEFATAIRTGTMYGDDVISTVASVALDTADANVIGRGINGIWRSNPSIVRTTLTNTDEIITLYRRTLTDGYIDELVAANPAKFAGKNIRSIKTEMAKLRAMIQKTKDAARVDGKFYNNNPLEPSFESNWLVENCAEIWAVRDAILQGSKIKNIVIRSVNIANGSLKPLCKNCTTTFSNIIKAME